MTIECYIHLQCNHAAPKTIGIMSHLCVWDLPVQLPQRGQGSCLTCACLGSACTAASKMTGIMSHLCVFGICLYSCLKEDRDHVSPVCVWDLPVQLPQRGQGSCLTCVCLGSACTVASKRTGIMSHLCVWDLPVQLPQRGQGSCLTCVCLGSACIAALTLLLGRPPSYFTPCCGQTILRWQLSVNYPACCLH